MSMTLQYVISVILALWFQQTAPVSDKVTDHFKIKYDRQLLPQDVENMQTDIESTYAKYRSKFGVTARGKTAVRLFANLDRFQSEAKPTIFDDGLYSNKSIMLNLSQFENDPDKRQKVLNRVVSQSMLDEVPACPNWFAAAYGLYAADDLHHFLSFFTNKTLTFDDLDEIFNRAQSRQDLSAAYAYAGETMVFFISRFGEHRIQKLITELKRGVYFTTAMSNAFGSSIAEIEKAWQRALPSDQKK